MFKTEKIERIVELALLTGFIEGDDRAPLSLMLIAPPEQGKTSIIRGFRCPKTIETADISPKVINDEIVPLLRTFSLNHLIIPDLTKVLGHKSPTVNATVSFFNALIEEGITRNLFFGQKFWFEDGIPRKCGLITSVTSEKYKDICRKWHEIGFTSRFLPVSYEYGPETIKEVHETIRDSVIFNKIIQLANPEDKYKNKYVIPIPDDIRSWASMASQDIAKKANYSFSIRVQGGHTKWINVSVTGFRLHKHLRQLLRAEALRRTTNNPTVNYIDLEEVRKLLDYITYPNDPKVI